MLSWGDGICSALCLALPAGFLFAFDFNITVFFGVLITQLNIYLKYLLDVFSGLLFAANCGAGVTGSGTHIYMYVYK